MSRAPRTRARTIRRRRIGALLVVLAVLVAGFATLMPTVDKAVKEVTLPLRHDDIIRQQAADKDLDPSLIAAVIYAESRFDANAESEAGARGLMQITRETASDIARRSGGIAFEHQDLSEPQINISYGSYYLRWLLDRYGDNVTLATAAYNAGTGNVDRWIGQNPEMTRRQIPFPETRAYVGRVLDAQREYRREYRRELGL
jgi:soluble lytic murein transglycosylase